MDHSLSLNVRMEGFITVSSRRHAVPSQVHCLTFESNVCFRASDSYNLRKIVLNCHVVLLDMKTPQRLTFICINLKKMLFIKRELVGVSNIQEPERPGLGFLQIVLFFFFFFCQTTCMKAKSFRSGHSLQLKKCCGISVSPQAN